MPHHPAGHEPVSVVPPAGHADPGWTHFCYVCGYHCRPAAAPDRCHYCRRAIPPEELNAEAGICIDCEPRSATVPVFCDCCDCTLTHAERCWETNWPQRNPKSDHLLS